MISYIICLYIIPLILGYILEYKVDGSTRHFSLVPLIPFLNIIWLCLLISTIINEHINYDRKRTT